MKLFVYPNLSKAHYIATTTKALNALMQMNDVECIFTKEDCEKLFHNQNYCKDSINDAQLIVSIGGDGTLLKASKLALQHNLPLVGINAGRRGYLCKYKLDEILELKENPFRGETISEREILSMKVNGKEYLALNDFVFSSRNAGYSIEATLTSRTRQLVYLASGFIIATPTGSTAYNVAAGGSILDPELHATAITPICACGDEKNSYIIDSHDAITISNNREYDPIDIYCDGEFVCELKEPLVVQRSQNSLKLIW